MLLYMGWRSLGVVAFVLFACAARTELQSATLCRPGDPPLLLASQVTSITALTTDGSWLYVTGSTFWSVPTHGGDATTLNPSPVSGAVGWNGGVYAITGEGALWIRHDGLARHGVAAGRFTPPTELDSEVVDSWDGWTLWARAIESGTTTISYTLPFWFAKIGLSARYLHAITMQDGKWLDERSDRVTGARADTIPLDFSDSATALKSAPTRDGPSAFCVRTTCVLDDTTTPVAVDLDTVLALDADFAYGASGGKLVRVGLRDTRRESLADFSPQAVAVANGCVYAASSDEVLRIAPSE